MYYLRSLFIGALLLLMCTTLFASPDIFVSAPDPIQRSSSSLDHLDETTVVWEYDFDDPANSMDDWTFVDGGYQDPIWQPRNFNPYGEDGFSWYCSPPWVWGGYEANNIQGLVTPAMNLTGETGILLNFWLCLQSEQNFDGGCVMIWYGDDEEDLTQAVLVPNYGPSYNGEVESISDAFGFEVNGWSGYDAANPFDFNEWSIVSFDLDPYAAPYVRIGFIFCSDANDQIGTGMQVDNIIVTGFGNTYFSDDADGNNVGGEFEVQTGIEVTGASQFPDYFQFFNNDNSEENGFIASTEPNCMGTHEYGPDVTYVHYINGPTISMPRLDYPLIDILKFSFSVKTGFDNGDADPETQSFYYVPEFKMNYGEENWVNVNAIDGGPNYAFDQFLNEGDWTNSLDVYDQGEWNFDISRLGNQEVQFRFRVVCRGVDLANDMTPEGDPINGFFDYLVWDDLKVTLLSMEHDIETEVIVPYPTTVGYPIMPRVKFTNISPRTDETGVVGECYINSFPTFLIPDATFDIASESYVERFVMEVPYELRADGCWIPYAPSTLENPFPIYSTHQLETDEYDRNDRFDASIVVQEAGNYELGYDARLQRRYDVGRSLTPLAVKIDPNDFEWFDVDTDLTLKGLVGGFWVDSTGHDSIPESLTWTILEDNGDIMGDEIWTSGVVPVTIDENQGIAQIVYHYLEDDDYITLPFEPFWIKLESYPYGSRILYQRNDNIPWEECPYAIYDDGEWVRFGYFETSRDAQIRAIVDGNIKPYNTAGMMPQDGASIDISENSIVTFRWVGGSPDDEVMTYTLYLEDDNGTVFDYTTSETSFDVDFNDEAMESNYWTWYVKGEEVSGLYTESTEYNLTITGLSCEEHLGLPETFALSNAYPNPFNPATTLRYQVPIQSHVKVTVVNILGQEVARLVDSVIQPGYYKIVFDAQSLSCGIYFVRMETQEYKAIQKVILLK